MYTYFPTIRVALTLALVACIAATALAADCPGGICAPPWMPREESETSPVSHPAVVRVRNEQPGGTADLGSGVGTILDDGRAVVLSCAHLFRQGAGRVWIVPHAGRAARAKLLALDAAYDLAALEVVGDANTLPPAARIADSYSPVGAMARACGFGPSGRYRQRTGRVVGYLKAGDMPTAETMLVEGAARSGDSGGPIFNERGEVAAVLWGTDGARSYGTCCLRVRQFLARLAGPRRAQPLSPIAPPRVESPPAKTSPTETAPRESIPAPSVPAQGSKIGAAAGTWLSGKAVALLVGVGVPGWAAALGVWLVMRRGRRRLAKRLAAREPAGPRLHDDYARELVEVFKHSGRSPVQDATLGREYDEELRRAADSSDATLARWARALRGRVESKFHRIHGESPPPAEPVASGV